LRATFKYQWASSLLPHVATILRPFCDPCYVQHPISGALLLDMNPNITCLQHRNSTSATLKYNVYNTQHRGASSSTQHPTSHTTSATSKINVCSIQHHLSGNIETQHLQHLKCSQHKKLDLILKHLHGIVATCKERAQHIHNDCNMNDKRLRHEGDRLQHAKNIIATPICNNCNKKPTGVGTSSPYPAHAPAAAAGAPPAPTAVIELCHARGGHGEPAHPGRPLRPLLRRLQPAHPLLCRASPWARCSAASAAPTASVCARSGQWRKLTLGIAGAAAPPVTCLPVLRLRKARVRPPATGSDSNSIRGRREERRRIRCRWPTLRQRGAAVGVLDRQPTTGSTRSR
jgi:hypothetical protein